MFDVNQAGGHFECRSWDQPAQGGSNTPSANRRVIRHHNHEGIRRKRKDGVNHWR